MQVVQIKCSLDPNHDWVHGAKPQASLDRQRQKLRWSPHGPMDPRTFQILPKWSWHRKHLWFYSATKALLMDKWFHFLLHFLEGLLQQNKNATIFLYSHKNLLRHRLPSFSTAILRANTHLLSCVLFPHLQVSLSKGQSPCMLRRKRQAEPGRTTQSCCVTQQVATP